MIRLEQLFKLFIILHNSGRFSCVTYNICPSDTILPTTSFDLISPNHPNNYADNTDCLLTVIIQPGLAILFDYYYSFRTESIFHDPVTVFLNGRSYISGGNPTVKDSNNGINLPKGIQYTNQFTIRFKSDGSNTHPGFKMRVFIGQISNVIDFNGALNGTSNMAYFFSNQPKYSRTIDIIFSGPVRCTNDSRIEISINKSVFENICNGTQIWKGKSIDLLVSGVTGIDQILHYSSRKRSIRRCTPDFDCGNKNCVPLSTVCDGFYDCDNDSDELNCKFPGEKTDRALRISATTDDPKLNATSTLIRSSMIESTVTTVSIELISASSGATNVTTQSTVTPSESASDNRAILIINAIVLIVLVILAAVIVFNQYRKYSEEGHYASVKFLNNKTDNIYADGNH